MGYGRVALYATDGLRLTPRWGATTGRLYHSGHVGEASKGQVSTGSVTL
jgi:hypothetical protein